MKIVADENIPYVNELFGPLGDVTTLHGRNIQPEHLSNANILLVRSVTPVNKKLLENSSIKFVGTCTIGVDHLDIEYLEQENIAYSSAPGCNANAVVQYVVSAITQLKRNASNSKNVVIVGGGNVGSRVYAALTNLGFNCSCVDPFLKSENVNMQLVSFDAIYSADIVCFHAPLTTSGPYPTRHLLNAASINQLKPGALLLNAGRGAVIDNQALLESLNNGLAIDVVLDVWENEPNINLALLEKVTLGTPHIAGYSFEGRLMGSLMIFDALCKFLQVDETELRNKVTTAAFGASQPISAKDFESALQAVYSVQKDYESLKSVADSMSESFDQLRKNYPQRREYSHFTLPENIADKSSLLSLGFISE